MIRFRRRRKQDTKQKALGAESKEFDLTQDIQHDTSNVISGSRIQEYQGSSFIEKCISLEPWNARPLEPF